ncbi:MAG TPA: YdcF family protein [Actinomycetales bacterium]
MRAVVRVLTRLVLLLLAAAVVLVAVTAARVWQAGRTDDAQRADVLVVLGAAQHDGRPQELLAARLDHAVELYRRDLAPVVMTVGGKRPGDRFTEADAGRTYLLEHDVPEADVVTVGVGSDTHESLRAAARLMDERGWTSAVVVTDPWHELRSTAMLADQGVTVHGSPVTTGPSVTGGGEARYVARETAAYLAYEIGRLTP